MGDMSEIDKVILENIQANKKEYAEKISNVFTKKMNPVEKFTVSGPLRKAIEHLIDNPDEAGELFEEVGELFEGMEAEIMAKVAEEAAENAEEVLEDEEPEEKAPKEEEPEPQPA